MSNLIIVGVSGPKRTGIMVEFADLAFHVRSPGDLSEDEVDEIIGFLSERMQTQERTELTQLQSFFDTLNGYVLLLLDCISW
jgi:ATP-dependent DNA helicase Q4